MPGAADTARLILNQSSPYQVNYTTTESPIFELQIYNFNPAGSVTLNIQNATLQTTGTNTGSGGNSNYIHAGAVININDGGKYLHNGVNFNAGIINVNAGGIYSNIVGADTSLYLWNADDRPKVLNVNSGGVWYANNGMNMGYNYGNAGTININEGGLFYRVTDRQMNVANRQGFACFNINGGTFINLQVTDGDSDDGPVCLCNNNGGGSTEGILTATDAVVSNHGRLVIVGSTASGYGATGIVNIVGGTWNQHGTISQSRWGGGPLDLGVLNIMSNATVVHSRGEMAFGRFNSYGELNINSGGKLLSIVNGNGVFLGGNLSSSTYYPPYPAKITVSGEGSLLECRGWGIRVGVTRSSNTLVVANGGTVVATQRARVGFTDSGRVSSNNFLFVNGGYLFVTNSAGTADLYVQYVGTFELNGGTAVVDRLYMYNANEDNRVRLNKGLFVIKNDNFDLNDNINRPLVVGNGTDPMTLRLAKATRVFFNSEIVVTNNGVLEMVHGATNQSSHVRLRGGTISPGSSVGTVWIQGALTMSEDGTYICEKGVGLNNTDKIICSGALTILPSGGTIKIVPLPGATPDGPSETNIIIEATSISGLANLELDLTQAPGFEGSLVQVGNKLGVVLTPEPGVAVVVLAVLAMAGWKRR